MREGGERIKRARCPQRRRVPVNCFEKFLICGPIGHQAPTRRRQGASDNAQEYDAHGAKLSKHVLRLIQQAFSATVSNQPTIAQVIVADATATWASNVTLSVSGTTPTNRSLALPVDVLLVVESNIAVSADLARLTELLPGLAAEVWMSTDCAGIHT